MCSQCTKPVLRQDIFCDFVTVELTTLHFYILKHADSIQSTIRPHVCRSGSNVESRFQRDLDDPDSWQQRGIPIPEYFLSALLIDSLWDCACLTDPSQFMSVERTTEECAVLSLHTLSLGCTSHDPNDARL